VSNSMVMSPREAVIEAEPVQAIPRAEFVLSPPQTIEETGLRRSLLEDLALKSVYSEGELNLCELADRMGLSLAIVEDVFQRLRKEQFCEVKGMVGSVYRVSVTSQGKARALECLSLNKYVGAAPVTLKDYDLRARQQSVGDVNIHFPDVERATEPLVLSDETLRRLGVAILSGASIMLYGPTGTGKTAIAENIPRVYEDSVWIPYAVEVDGQIITVYDSSLHRRIERPVRDETDGRWVLCRRPRVVVGGELTFEMLDLQFNPATGFYAAPLQMKANNGVLIIDDFGRQRIRPEELFNRWIIPLDRKVDSLTLAGGKKFEIPFDTLVVFATNLDPAELADEAFLRRIQSKIEVGNATPEQFHEIFRRVCRRLDLACEAQLVQRLIDFLRTELNLPLRPCYARDLVQQICWEARFEGKPPMLDWTTLVGACRSYFLSRDLREDFGRRKA
jgi:predicted ATPase with chaperone activity